VVRSHGEARGVVNDVRKVRQCSEGVSSGSSGSVSCNSEERVHQTHDPPGH